MAFGELSLLYHMKVLGKSENVRWTDARKAMCPLLDIHISFQTGATQN